MRRTIVILAAAAAFFSCRKPLFDTMPRWYDPRVQRTVAQSQPPDGDQLSGNGVYVTAIRFPEWAKWKEGDYRGAEAVLFRDSVEILSVPAGPRPDADRIRICDGHLWTDIADEGVTRICRDGILQFSFPDEELLRGFLLDGDKVHTLGQRPGGGGLCYRINGEEVFSSMSGSILGSPADREWEGGALMQDSTGVYYVYGIPFHKGEQTTTEYHIMRGADEIKVIPPNFNGAIYDIRVLDGGIYRSERRNQGAQSLCLAMNDLYLALDIGPEEQSVHQCRLIPLEGQIMVKGYSNVPGGNLFWIRSKDGFRFSLLRDDIRDIYLDGSERAVFVTEDGMVSCIMMSHSVTTLVPRTYRLTTPGCAQLRDGFFAAALSNQTGPEHLLLLDGKSVKMNFNGFFTSIKIK